MLLAKYARLVKYLRVLWTYTLIRMVYVWNRKMRVVSNGFWYVRNVSISCLQWHEFRIGEANGTSQWMCSVVVVPAAAARTSRRVWVGWCWNAVVILFINYVRFYFDAEIKSTFTLIEMIGCEHQPHTHHKQHYRQT